MVIRPPMMRSGPCHPLLGPFLLTGMEGMETCLGAEEEEYSDTLCMLAGMITTPDGCLLGQCRSMVTMVTHPTTHQHITMKNSDQTRLTYPSLRLLTMFGQDQQEEPKALLTH